MADLVLHVLDASAPDDELDEMRGAVEEVLGEIGAGETPVELVLNKVDLVDSLRRRRLRNRHPHALLVSAATGEGLDELRRRLAEHFEERFEAVEMLLPYGEGARLAELYRLGAPIQERTDREDGVLVRAHLPRRELPRYAPFIVASSSDAADRRARSVT